MEQVQQYSDGEWSITVYTGTKDEFDAWIAVGGVFEVVSGQYYLYGTLRAAVLTAEDGSITYRLFEYKDSDGNAPVAPDDGLVDASGS